MKPSEVFRVGLASAGAGVRAGQVLGRGGGRAGLTSRFGHRGHEDRVVSCTWVRVLAGAGAGLLRPSPSLSARLPTLLLFILHMPGPRSAQTVEISFAENYTSDQNVS